MSAVTTLICDDCGRIIAVAATAEAARAEVARREAHVRLAAPGGRDLCGPCALRSVGRAGPDALPRPPIGG